MTNSERITAHNARLAAMKETVAGLPEAGGGGGGAVETCTVRLVCENQNLLYGGYYAVTGDGLVDTIDYANVYGPHDITIPNVLCNSVLFPFLACIKNYYPYEPSISGDASYSENYLYLFQSLIFYIGGKQDDVITITINIDTDD